MPLRRHARVVSCVLLLVSCVGALTAQHSANNDADYTKLRDLLPGQDVIEVNNLELKRDAGVFTFRTGSFAFYEALNGKITGAVFIGEGHFHLTPPTKQDRHSMSILAHSEEFDDDFDGAVLRFTDLTDEELRRAATSKGIPNSTFAKAASEFHTLTRLKLKENLDLRILEDLISPTPGGFFLAAMHGRKNSHLIYRVDPHGATDVSPEEVSLLSWSEWGEVYPAAFSAKGAGDHRHNEAYTIDTQDLDITIEKSGFLSGLATVHVIAVQDGLAVVPLMLYSTLRVSRVETEKGDLLDYVQEKKDEDADFGVILRAPLKKGESTTIRIAYGGKDVVLNKGGFNYYPIEDARDSWHPNILPGSGNYSMYHMRFHVPKPMQLIATGTKTSEATDGKYVSSEWKSDVPLAMAGFNLANSNHKRLKWTISRWPPMPIPTFLKISMRS